VQAHAQVLFLRLDIQEDLKTPLALPQTPRTPMVFQAAQGSHAESRNLTNAPPTPFLSRRESGVETNGHGALSPEALSDLKARVMEAYKKQNVDSDDASSDMLDLDPNAEYAKIKLRMLERGREVPECADLNLADANRLTELREHYFFKEKDADAAFRQLKNQALAAAKDARLRDPNAPPPFASLLFTPKKTRRKERPPSLLSPAVSPRFGSPKKQSSDITDDSTSEASGEGGMFGNMLDEVPTSEVVVGTNGNTTVRIRDMSLPKQWGGRTPKILLTETVYKIDRYAAVSYILIGGTVTSRVVRSGVSIRWGSTGRQKQLRQEWLMEEDGCLDQAQSEQFIATVALHALTFTATPGFASPSNSGSGAQTHFRMLPPVYRDLWDELEAKRKDAEDATNRSIWRQLKGIAEPRIGAALKVT
jgi:ATP-dependent RNA helicase DHX29